ncbi:MAG: ATPase domain-containing protein [Thermoplasmata archaeon]
MSERARVWEGLLQRVVEANIDLVSTRRLKGHLDRLAEKYPALSMVSISEGKVSLADGFPEGDTGLAAVCVILGAIYWILDMFTGPSAAAERLRGPVRRYLEEVMPGGVLGLNRFLPKLHLEREPGEAAGEGGEGAAVSLPVGRAEEGAGAKGEAGATEAGEGQETGEVAAGADELASRFTGAVEWLGERLPRGSSILVEGQGQLKERMCLRFIKEGLERGEAALVVLARPPEEFRRLMMVEGLDTARSEELGLLQILDWHTFRERRIEDLEDEGSVKRLPMELPHVGAAINMALQELPQGGSPRAFVDILPRALATVAIETVFNFVAVTILKFRKRAMTALFLMEEERDPEKAAIRLSFNSSVEIQEAEGGRVTVRVRGPLLRGKLKVLRPEGAALVVESERPLPAEEMTEPELLEKIRSDAAAWRSQGYIVDALEEALRGPPARAKEVWERYKRAVEALQDVRSDLRIMDLTGVEVEAARIQDMARNPELLPEVEEAMKRLRQKFQALKEARARDAEAREAGVTTTKASAVERGGEGARTGAGLSPESCGPGGAEVAGGEEEIIEIQMEEGGGEEAAAGGVAGGAEVGGAEREGHGELQIQGAAEGAEAREGKAPPMGGEGAGAVGVAGAGAAAPALGRETGPTPAPGDEERRKEFREAIERWRAEGYNVAPLERALEGDIEEARRAFVLFRVQLQRLRELGEELAAINVPALEKKRAALKPLLKDVERIPELESSLKDMREELELVREEERARKEEEQRRRAALSEKMFWWHSHGIDVHELERALEGGLEEAEAAFREFEEGARRLIELREELSAPGASDFPEEVAALEAKLTDVHRVREAEEEVARFKEHLRLHSRVARERRALTERVEALRARGFLVEGIEGLMDKDLRFAERELQSLEANAEVMGGFIAQLEGMDVKGFEREARELRERMRDPRRLEECRRDLLRLRHGVERARAEEREREGYRRQVEEWKRSGLQTSELEAALGGDLPSLRRAIIKFRLDLQLHDELLALLEPLLHGKHAAEAARIQQEMRDFSKLPELEKRILELRLDFEEEALARGREKGRELERELELHKKLAEWIQSGYQLRRLESALRADPESLRAEVERLDKDIEQLSKLASALEVLDTRGHERDLNYIRSMLNDPDKVAQVRSLHEALKLEISRRKKEEERRAAMRAAIREWKQKGYSTEHLEKNLEGDLDRASQELILFKLRVAAAEHLKARLELLEALGHESEASELRQRVSSLDGIEKLHERAEKLMSAAEQRRRERAERRSVRRRLRAELGERLLAWAAKGLVVKRLERALEGPIEEAPAEFERFEADVRRLGELEKELDALDAAGLEAEVLSLKSKLNDVDKIKEIEEGIRGLRERLERERKEAARRRELDEARRLEAERAAAVRKRLEERLAEWSAFGYNVDALRAALAGDLKSAEARFADFENALFRTEELRMEFHELLTRGIEDVPGAETVERLLQDPLKLPQAEKAFREFRQRAEATLEARSAEMRELAARVAALKESGEDVSALERAMALGVAELRKALEEFEKQKKIKGLEATWKGIKRSLKGSGGEGSEHGGGAVKKANKQRE